MISASYTRGVGLQALVSPTQIPTVSVSHPVDSIEKTAFHTKSISPHFGCRLFGFMSAGPNQEQAKLLQMLFSDSENSLVEQAALPPESEKVPRNFEMLITKTTVPNGSFITGRLDEGCGRVRFDDAPEGGVTSPKLHKALHGVYADKTILGEVKQFEQKIPATWMLHLREAFSTLDPSSIKLENSHPFRLGDFAFMHSGTLSPKATRWMQQQAARYHQQFPNEVPAPEGTADSELIFLSLMGQLRKKYGTTDARKLSTEQIESVFQDLLKRLNWLNNRPNNGFSKLPLGPLLNKTTGFNVNQNSHMSFPYGMTFFLSDGQRTFLSRSNRSLHVTGLPDKDGRSKVALVSSYPITLPKDSGFPPLHWWLIPEHHMVTLERDRKNETVQCKLNPFSTENGSTDGKNLWGWKLAMQMQFVFSKINEWFHKKPETDK